ncbi:MULTISPECIES: glycosyltransferase family 4 protein [Microbacterium]|uniref:glycosyltransferase family 4 protein n=1 Tax=Microbacterium TaxID=33882 RepID=UPI0027D79125|nr:MULTISPECIES: glycosyltransferase family 4 protein [Microbacterium]
MQPIASQRWLEGELAKEASRNPSWSHALQGLDRDREQLADMAIEMQLADVFIAGSHLVRRSLEADGLGPTIVQHYGVDDRVQRAPVMRRPEIDDSPIRLLFVGQVNQRKGISYLLEAMRQLEGLATLKIVGRGSDLTLRSILSLGLKNVSLTGPFSTERVLVEYQKSHLLVLPSLAEGFSLVVPEAMSTGLPCIVSEHAGSHEIVTHGRDGFVVPIADSAAIVSCVHEIRRRPDLLAQMSEAAARKGRTLTWDRFGEAAAYELVTER